MDHECDLPIMNSHVAVRLANCIIAFGGNNKDDEPLSHHVIWMYNINTEHWGKHVIPDTKLAPPTTRNSCAVVVELDIYMFGGFVPKEGKNTNTLWKLTVPSTQPPVWNKVIAKSQEKTPSPRCLHSGWESTGKLWTFGGVGTSLDGYLNEHESFPRGSLKVCNNQLLCFDVSKQEWKDVKSSGTKPEPRCGHATTMINSNVWLYGGLVTQIGRKRVRDELYQLNLHSLVWTQIKTADEMKPQGCFNCSFSGVTDSQIILHGGRGHPDLQSTWIFDVQSLAWKQLIIDGRPRYFHTGTECMNGGVIIIGGERAHTPYRFIYVQRNAKSLQQLAMKTIYKYKGNLPWRALPKRLITQVMFPGITENLA